MGEAGGLERQKGTRSLNQHKKRERRRRVVTFAYSKRVARSHSRERSRKKSSGVRVLLVELGKRKTVHGCRKYRFERGKFCQG